MRQRVMIAIALACRPPLIIADEPTTALDVTIQAQVLELMRELKARFNLALLLITHDFGVIAEMADRVAVMYKGRLVEQGDVRQILRQPAHEYTRALLAAVPGMTGRPEGPPLQRDGMSPEVRPDHPNPEVRRDGVDLNGRSGGPSGPPVSQ
jgi:ABC-type dipeptide/oligopeptide/nickel transport system ATPase component